MLTAGQRNMLLVADRTRRAEVVAAVIGDVLDQGLATPLDIELAFRDARAETYLIAGDELAIVFGMPAWLAALKAAGVTPEDNRAKLAA
jgi:hypothetical protein